MPARTIIVGDVHGMLPELQSLVSKAGLSRNDQLVFVGDLVDKGPESAGVVRFARELRDDGFDVVLVQGNHEEKHSRFRTALRKGGDKAVRKFKGREEIGSITDALSPEDVAFLDSAVPLHRLPDHDAVVLHGGVLPVWESLDASDKGIVSRLLRVRHVTGKAVAKVTVEFVLEGADAESDLSPEQVASLAASAVELRRQVRPAGSFISLGNETDEDPFWADVYDGRFGHVYFGHNPYPDASEPVPFPHATGLDLGAVFGGHLAAVVLESGKALESVVVEASGKFATGLWDD
jgi:hypothetical protein